MIVGIDLALLKETESSPNIQSFMSDLVSKLQLTRDVIQESMKDSAVKSKVFFTTEIPKYQKLP